MPSTLLKQSCEPECGDTGPVKHLAVAETNRRPTIDRRIQITVDVPIALGRGVVEQTAVELDDEGVVLDVAVDDTQGRVRTTLTLRARQAMSPFDAVQVPVLEHGASSRRHILEDALQPDSSWSALANVESRAHPGRGCPPGLDSGRKHAQSCEIGR